MAGGRAMVVTGASSGIGRALAERAVRAGYGVLAVGRREDRLAELARSASTCAGTIVTLALDLREPGAPERIIATARTRFGRLDVLVNNAGGAAVGAITLQPDEALREQFETHVFVPLALVRESLDLLRASHGHVFFLGSGVARVPVGGLGAYPCAKAAVRSMSRIVGRELRAGGIAVTYVDPGAVDTEFMTRAGMQPPPRSFLASPHDVARKIFDAVGTRRRVLNAVPWQTAFVALAELFPDLTDALLERSPQLAGGAAFEAFEAPPLAAAPSAPPEASAALFPAAPAAEVPPAAALPNAFDAALALHAARMRKLNLSRDFVAGLLVPGTTLELGEVALRWAGMPNKNERAVTLDVLDALADARFLTREGVHRYRVVRAADAAP